MQMKPHHPSTAPIGIFDSGVGGLSIWREIVQQFPHEATLYFADQAHIPYGSRSLDEIRAFSEAITHFLLDQGAKLIVVACNTASGAALHHLRETFPTVPFVGMEPAVKPAAEHTHTGVIGVIATPATFQGDLFQTLAVRFASNVTLHTQACPGLVEAVESGTADAPEAETLLREYITPLLDAGIDQLVLGCTHYPFLIPAIRRILDSDRGPHDSDRGPQPNVTISDPAPAVARQAGRVLAQRGLSAPTGVTAHHRFFTSGDAQTLAEQARLLVGYTGIVHAF